MTIAMLLMIVAIVLLFLAAFGVPLGRVQPGWLGLALIALSMVLRV